MCRVFSLDAGESEALALMEKNPNAIFLTDDASARLVAEQMGFRTHGTIGVLNNCEQEKQPLYFPDLNIAFTFAIQDLKISWRWYRMAYEKEMEK